MEALELQIDPEKKKPAPRPATGVRSPALAPGRPSVTSPSEKKLRLINMSLAHIYCSTTLLKYGLIRLKKI